MSTHQIAQGLAGLGRHGDSVMVHMSPHEVAGLQALAKSHGTSLTINPHTGMPEAFSLGGLFKAAIPMVAGAMLGPGGAFGAEGLFGMGSLGAGMLVGAATGLMTGSPLQGVMGGLGAYGGSEMYNTLANAGQGVKASVEETAKNALKNTSQAGGELTKEQLAYLQAENPTGFANAINANAASTNDLFMGNQAASQIAPAASNAYTQQAANAVMAPNFNPAGGYVPGSDIGVSTYNVPSYGQVAQNAGLDTIEAVPEMSRFDYAVKGIKELPTKEGWEAYKNAGGTGMKLAMAGAGPLMGGLERSDIYGEPATPKKKSIPTLNLSDEGYTPLNLNTNYPTSYAAGGLAELSNAQNMPSNNPMSQSASFQQTSQSYNPAQATQYSIQPQQQNTEPSPQGPQQMMQAPQQQQPTQTTQGQQSTITTGGIAGMYNQSDSQDNTQLSQDGYGLGRLNKMAQGYATGGPVSFADGGALQGGGAAAMQGAPQFSAINDTTSANPVGIMNLLKIPGFGGANASGPQMGLFATQEQIDKARADYAAQQAAQHFNQNGFGALMHQMYGQLGGMQDPTYVYNPNENPFVNLFASLQPHNSTQAQTLDHLNLNKQYADGGPVDFAGLAMGGPVDYAGMAKGGYLDGPGDGMSDSIPASIEGKQPARLADGEFVVPADVVSHLGNGSTKAGSQRLYGMLDKVRKARTGTKKQGKQINPDKFLPT